MRWSGRGTAIILACVSASVLWAQAPGWQADPEVVRRTTADQPGFNYDEARVAPYTLPDLLGAAAKAPDPRDAWPARRAEILELFREHVYGRSPGAPDTLRFEVVERQPKAMDGAATLQRVTVTSVHRRRQHAFEIVLFLPNARAGAVPLFLLLNNRPVSNTDPTRAERSPFWPAEAMIARGYGIAAIQNQQIAADNAESFRDAAMALFEEPGQARGGDAWGALAAWAWGASRAMDYFETNPRVDAARVAVVGHSRGGKAALWAGAEDERFALVVSNDSGEGGAALARRNFGETTARINGSFPHWFAANYRRYDGAAESLPVDQHMLLALIAPRALYVASANEDLWADPRGEFLSLAHSSPAYALFGEPSITPDAMPAIDTPLVAGRRAYHVRTGGHNLTEYDWARYADFADRIWKE